MTPANLLFGDRALAQLAGERCRVLSSTPRNIDLVGKNGAQKSAF